MRTLRTFFWHDRVKSRWALYRDRHIHKKAWNDFRFGNSGDIFARDLLTKHYPGFAPINCATGARILCVGSIAHKFQHGDVLAGVGCKTRELPLVHSDAIKIHALRGPLSFDIFKAAGYDMSQVRFLADPGLMIGRMIPSRKPISGRVVFIPHYRERQKVWKRPPKHMRLIDIDSPPLRLARQIQRAECVYSSSLHGIIFAHSLGRPCVFVRPTTEEPMLKYDDYYFSIGMTPPLPLDSIYEANFRASPNSPPDISKICDTISFPHKSQLEELGILV